MRKLREVLRLRFELKLGYQQIGRSCAIAVSTVHKYLKRAEAAGVTWPLPEDWDEARVEAVVFPRSGVTAAAEKARRERHPTSPRSTSRRRIFASARCNRLWSNARSRLGADPGADGYGRRKRQRAPAVQRPVIWSRITWARLDC